MRDILFISVTLMVSGIAVFRPGFGILSFIFFGFFNPQSFTWGLGLIFPGSQLIAISTMLGALLSRERKWFRLRQEVVLLVLLWCTFCLSTFFALKPEWAFSQLEQISKILLMVAMTMMLVTTRERLQGVIRIIGLSLGFFALKGGVFAITSGGGDLVYGPSGSFLAANNSIGLAMAMNVPILFYLLRTETNVWLLWTVRAMVLFSFPAVVCTYSRGAWLGLVTATALTVLKSNRKFLYVPAAGVLLVVLQTFAPVIAPDRLVQRYDTLVNYESESSAQSRFWNWEFCRRVGFARPLNGGGFGFSSFQAYADYYPEFLERWPGKIWSCHSTWLSILGEHGFVAFALWLALLVSCFIHLKRIRKYGTLDPEKSTFVHYADMLQGSLVTYLVVGTFLDAAYFDMFYYLVAVTVIVKELAVAGDTPTLAQLSAARGVEQLSLTALS